MRSILSALCCGALHLPLFAGELKEEIGSYEEAFHQALHQAPELYLVCYYQVEKKPWGKEWEQLHIKATIVDVVRGERKVGDRIEFGRVLDGKYGDVSKLPGALYYVQYFRNEHEGAPESGKLDIDPQDPLAIFRYDSVVSAMAADHKAKAQQAGAHEPAARPESDSEGEGKPQPESEGRSR